MAKRLTRTVYIGGEAYGPSSVIPADVAKRITNPNVWVDDDSEGAPDPGVQSPPPAARADGEPPSEDWTVKELRDYAKARSITLGDAKAKDAILAVLAEHAAGGTPTEGDIDESDGPGAGGEESESDDEDGTGDTPEV